MNTATSLLIEAVTLHQAGNHAEAAPLFHKAHLANPNDAHLCFLYGSFLCDSGDYAKTITLMTPHQTAAAKPEYNALLGWAYCQTGDHEKARPLLEHGHAAHPDNMDWVWRLAYCAFSMHDYAAALPLLDRVIAHAPLFAPAHLLRCMHQIRTKPDMPEQYNRNALRAGDAVEMHPTETIALLARTDLHYNHEHQRKRYDHPLQEIGFVVGNHFQNLRALDIGGYIGIAPTRLNRYHSIAALSVEPRDAVYALVNYNTQRANPENRAEWGYAVATQHLTPPAGDTTPRFTFTQLLAKYPAFTDFKLIKIDTDGFDFLLISDHADLWRKNKPIMYFEYDPLFQEQGEAQGLDAINTLTACGYTDFVVYDNFGNFMLTISDNAADRFAELNYYIAANKAAGFAVYYVDVCAFHADDKTVFNALRSLYLNAPANNRFYLNPIQ